MLDDSYFMKQALIEAVKAGERGEVPVGAVVVCKERIIARAHNPVSYTHLTLPTILRV